MLTYLKWRMDDFERHWTNDGGKYHEACAHYRHLCREVDQIKEILRTEYVVDEILRKCDETLRKEVHAIKETLRTLAPSCAASENSRLNQLEQTLNEHGKKINEQDQTIIEHGKKIIFTMTQLQQDETRWWSEYRGLGHHMQLIAKAAKHTANELKQTIKEQDQKIKELQQKINEQDQTIKQLEQLIKGDDVCMSDAAADDVNIKMKQLAKMIKGSDVSMSDAEHDVKVKMDSTGSSCTL